VTRGDYRRIVSDVEKRLESHGDSHLGVGWPKREDADTRYRVMLEVMGKVPPDEPVTLLDLGCGAAHLYDDMLRRGLAGGAIAYTGLDLSEKFLALCRAKHPGVTFLAHDVLADPPLEGTWDYVVMNGVLTQKVDLTFDEMLEYAQALVPRAFALARRGLAFNVMSKHVDWERDDLFHLPFDTLAAFLRRDVSRDFVFRNDYGLFEYTTYVYRRP
jgi:SAM-dependent methyltransferase